MISANFTPRWVTAVGSTGAWSLGQGCRWDHLPGASCLGEEQPPFLSTQLVKDGAEPGGKHWDFPMSLWGLSLTPSALIPNLAVVVFWRPP